MCKQGSGYRAYGAGLLSSFGELEVRREFAFRISHFSQKRSTYLCFVNVFLVLLE
jgi:hypothetical protein